MADTFTTNLNLTKPEVGASTDTWGGKINADLDAVDAIFSATGTAVHVKFASANFDDNAKAIFGTGDDLEIYHDGSNNYIKGATSDQDIIFQGNDGGSNITALTLDMSAAGAATFNDKITAVGTSVFTNLDISGDIDVDGTTNLDVVDIDGAVDMATTLAVAGTATFAGLVDAAIIDGVNFKVNGGQGSDGQVLTSTGSGVAWEAAAASGPTFKTFGTGSIMVGDDATGTINAANYNTGLGLDVFAALTSGDNNTVVGFNTGAALTSGEQNTFIGTNSGQAVTTGNQNVALGQSALLVATTGSKNTMLGHRSGAAITTAGENTFIGNESGESTTTGGLNTFIGHQAGEANTTGSSNIFVGTGAGDANTTAADNIAVGVNSLSANTTGHSNTAVGKDALLANTTATKNTAVGFKAAVAVTTGTQNTAMGEQALSAVTTTNNNTAIGYRAMTVAGAAECTAIGTQALNACSGSNNTALGWQAGVNVSSANNNTLIGKSAGDEITTSGQNTVVGQGASISAGDDQGNQVVLGQGLTGVGYHQGILGGINAVYNQGNSTAWQTTSDERIKKNIEDYTLGLDVINGIRTRTFDYRRLDEIPNGTDGEILSPNELPEGQRVGVIAQEIIEVLPSCVKEHPNSRLSVTTDNILWTLINAVQELSAKNDALEARITTLEG